MDQIICPIDGKPCEKDCRDRYQDKPEGGCALSDALAAGDISILFPELKNTEGI